MEKVNWGETVISERIGFVSKAIGHSSIKQTEHYARLLGKTVVEDMKKLL